MLYYFFNCSTTTEIYTLSLHDALPISSYFFSSSSGAPVDQTTSFSGRSRSRMTTAICVPSGETVGSPVARDRKSTRLNSSHGYISYAVFCLKKKNKEDASCLYPLSCSR